MISMSRRIILLILFAMLALPMVQLASPATAIAQTSDDAELLAGYISQAQTAAPQAGPTSGTLTMDGGADSTSSLDVELADQLIHLDVQVPLVDEGEIWAVAVAFRSTGDQFHYFLYWSDGGWSYSPAGGGNVQSGEAPLPGAAGDTVSIDIAAIGPAGYVGINGEYTTTLDLSSQPGAGNVTISANLIGAFDPSDEPMSFSNFTVWPLAAGTPPVEASPAASPAAATPAEPVAAQATATATAVTEPAASPAEPAQAEATPTSQTEPAPAEATVTGQEDPAPQPEPSQDDASTFNTLLATTAAEPVIFGPVDDVLPHDPDSVAFYPANVSVADFVARVECIGTVAVAGGFWDCGIAFGDTATADSYFLGYISDGYWFLSIGLDEPLQQGTDAPISTAVGDKVTLNLIVIGADGYFGINGEFIARLDLSELSGPGTIDLTSAFFTDTTIEGGALQFEDFMVWSLDSATASPVATATGQVVVEETPTPATTVLTPTTEAGATVVPPTTTAGTTNVVGNTYTSPTYNYSLSWNDTWTVDSDVSDETGDYLGLVNGVVFADLIGEPWNPADGSCFDRLIQFYSTNPAYSNIQSATDNVSANPGIWDITGILTLTYTEEPAETATPDPAATASAGTSTDYINYVSCSQLPGQDAIVSLEQFVPVADFRGQVDAMDDLRGSFVPNVGTVIVEETPTSVAVEESPTAIAGQTTSVVGNTYTSPTFGYSLTWDDTYEVEIDESESGVDYLRISNGTISADLFAAGGENTPTECVDDLILYYENDPRYSDVQFVTDAQNAPIATEGDGFATALISFTFTGEDGVAVMQYDAFTCYRLEEQGAMLVLEIFTTPSDSVLQSAAIAELQDSLVLPGGAVIEPTVVTQQTPAVDPTATAVEPTVAPPIEEALAATFLLSPIGDSGVQGTGTLEGEARLVAITAIVIGGAPGDLVAIHRGSCDTINPLDEPDYIVGELDESGLLRGDVQVRLTVLAGQETYSVVIYGAGDDFSAPLACGEIEGR